MKNAKEKERERQETLMRCAIMLVFVFLAAIVAVGVYYASPIQINVVTAASNTGAEQASVPNDSLDDSEAEEEEIFSAAASSGAESEFEVSSQPESGAEEVLVEKSIDLNTADKEELERIPGIGPTLAERIIQYREETGRFVEIEELEKVEGIGEKIFMKTRDYVYVE